MISTHLDGLETMVQQIFEMHSRTYTIVEVIQLNERAKLIVWTVVFLLPILISSVISSFPLPSRSGALYYLADYVFMIVWIIAFFGMLLTLRSMEGIYLPSYYRPAPKKHYCPYCNFPYASVKDSTCVYCGASLQLENGPPENRRASMQ